MTFVCVWAVFINTRSNLGDYMEFYMAVCLTVRISEEEIWFIFSLNLYLPLQSEHLCTKCQKANAKRNAKKASSKIYLRL